MALLVAYSRLTESSIGKYLYEKIQGNRQCSRDVGRNYSLRPKSSSGIYTFQGNIRRQKRATSTTADWLIMRFDEIAPKKPLSPEQTRLKSMKDRVKRDQQAVNAERARQKIKAGQAELSLMSKSEPANL